MARPGLAWMVVVLLWLAPMATAELSLSGTHSFTAQDTDGLHPLDAPLPEAQAITVPGGWRGQNIPDHVEVGWTRLRFSLSADTRFAAPAIDLGVVLRADAVFLNGTQIGGVGVIGPAQSALHNYPPTLPRLYPFDATLLRPGDNTLDIRIARIPYVDEGGILGPDVRLVEQAEALPGFFQRSQRFAIADYLLLGTEISILLLLALALFIGLRDRALLWFGLLFVVYFIASFEQRHLAHSLGLEAAWIDILAAKIGVSSLILLIEFAACVTGRTPGWGARGLQGAFVLLMLPLRWVRDVFGLPVDMAQAALWPVLLILTFGLALVWSVLAIRAGQRNAGILLGGLFLTGVGMGADVLLPASTIETSLGLQGADLGFLAFILSLILIIARRVRDNEQALMQANANITLANEVERNRLARDLHDGMGQWLSSIKLNLQMLKQEAQSRGTVEAGQIDGIVDTISIAIEDTRRVAHDLSPAFLDQQDLASAIRSHLDHVLGHSGATARTDLDPVRLGQTQRNHLYRIFQEALKNALDHGQASALEVQLDDRPDQVILRIGDNGRGFDRSAAEHRPGLGLRSMADRAQLIGARLEITSRPAAGTQVTVTLPRPR